MADAGLARVRLRQIPGCGDSSVFMNVMEHHNKAGRWAFGYYGFEPCDACLSLLVAAIRKEALEEAAKVPDQWANSQSCSEHQHDPCCHVRTGAGIARAIRALSQEVEPHADPRAVPDEALAAAQEKALEATRSARGCGAELFYGVSHYLARSYVTNCHQCAILFGEAYAAALGSVPAVPVGEPQPLGDGPRGEEVERIVRETITEYRGPPHFDSYEEWVERAVARVHARLGRKGEG